MGAAKLRPQQFHKLHLGDDFHLLSFVKPGKPIIKARCCRDLPHDAMIAYRLYSVNSFKAIARRFGKTTLLLMASWERRRARTPAQYIPLNMETGGGYVAFAQLISHTRLFDETPTRPYSTAVGSLLFQEQSKCLNLVVAVKLAVRSATPSGRLVITFNNRRRGRSPGYILIVPTTNPA